uniref:Glucose-methanol-choline oxidoreductase N-terminal domain-containing protein n=1 Tax=Chlamydomonas leiostraca TaxID=1034604 RepID=A0A7S0S699_9CHLO|mmetsp:Transcript_9037/g.22337  ORF Transcript_9037/g.22337 Transcript_9037/m.22337 type:complete len:615 (+) Transcript_9037:49-1893(+)
MQTQVQRRGALRASRSTAAQGRRSVVQVRASASPVAGQKWDYVIVGGGTAGAVLANRLSADESKKVLVLEAGGSADALEIAIPAGLTKLFRHPTLDWGLFSVNQKPLDKREVYLARGKTLGGSSCTNATLYHRGSPADYDSWGLDGWSSKELVDLFVAAENYSDGPAPYHGQGGTMNVERPRYDNPLHEEFFRACKAAGLSANPDFNDWSRTQAGYGEFQVTQKNGQRADMNRMYLKPIQGKRPNLTVLTGTRTTKVAFESDASGTPRTVGVEFSQASVAAGERYAAELAPGGEVVLCTGAIHSPHLLQLSGVGPGSALRDHNISVVRELRGVGANLQDHPATLYAARTDDKFDELAVTSQIYDKKQNIKFGAVLQYLFNKRGPLATTGCDHGAFVSTTGKGEPDLQMRFVPGMALDADAIQSYIKFAELKKSGEAWPCGITIQLLAVRAKSTGSVGLKSADPFAAPAINIGYFTDKGGEDMATLREGLKLSRRICEQSPLAQYITEERFPGTPTATDADLDAFIRKTTCSGNALVGTCKMGAASDPTAVVSAEDFKVHGVSGLRVVDASVIPRIPGGQMGAPVVMIAERAAALMTKGTPIAKGGKSGKTLVAA